MGQNAPESRGPMFRISYEILVRAFIIALLGVLGWTYYEINSVRKEKADRVELYEWRATLDGKLNKIAEGVNRLETMHLKPGQGVRLPNKPER